jgi:hypothetical protein
VSEKSQPADRAENGPLDSSEAGVLKPHLNFGSLRITPVSGIGIRADLDEATKRIVAVTLEVAGQRLQLQAFAAPKSEGLWLDAVSAMESSIAKQGGKVERLAGALGPELKAEVVIPAGGGRRSVRYVGVDGPRWMLRGAMLGDKIFLDSHYQQLIGLFRSVVVDRGDTPLPPNELLPLSIPQERN